jgi:filamentous hemagglutinin
MFHHTMNLQDLAGRIVSRSALLAGTSALALLLAAPQPVSARQLGAGAASSTTGFATNAAQAASQQAATIARQSQSALTRATLAIQSMQAVQNAARNAAASGANSLGAGLPAVTDGLSAGGLIPDSGLNGSGQSNAVTTWVGASAPTQNASNGQTTVTVQQSQQYALLNWQQFNIGKNTTLVFDQGGNSNYVALNKINDPSGVPSQILGSIRADGAVYLINQNGIIFGGSSQINVHTLIASSLDLNDSYATDPSNSRFLTGKGILSSSGTTSFTSVDTSGNQLYSAGPVTVQAGAQITAPGGDVLLLAPNVRNDGAISAPSGQVLLLGGSDVMLNTGDSFTRGFVVLPNPNAANPNVVNGLLASTTPGSVINNGSISSPQGNITIVAGSVNQNGVLTSTTSTTANGSIIIQAQAGNLVLGGVNDNPLYGQYGAAAEPSLIQILPDATDQALVTDTQAIANSSIMLTGVNVDIKGIVQLHGYDVTNGSDHPGGIAITALGTLDSNGAAVVGRVFLEDGSVLDGSGTTDAVASASRNSVAVELRSSELRDSPVVRAGPLYQRTIYVDASASGTNADGTVWQGTPLADASAWIALTGRSLEERMMNGAPITIGGNGSDFSSGAVQLMQAAGSVINVSGGFLTYAPGFVGVSTLIAADGRMVSATNANPNLAYVGVCCSFTVDHSHWGVTETYSSALGRRSGYLDPGYIQGGAGGSLSLNVSAAVLDGSIYSSVLVGEKQRTLATAPPGASLIANGLNSIFARAGNSFTTYNAESINLSDAEANAAAGWATGFDVGTDLNTLLATRSENAVASDSVYIPASWLNSGFTNVSLAANNTVRLAAGNDVSLPAGGSFSASANTVEIGSSIGVAGGTIKLAAVYTSHTVAAPDGGILTNSNGTLSFSPGLVSVIIDPGVTLSTAGSWTNDLDGGQNGPVAINGGTVTVNSYGNITLGKASIIDVSGGARRNVTGKIASGDGGSLTLAAGLALPHPASNDPSVSLGYIYFGGAEAGQLLAGQLKGYGSAGSGTVGNGGTLNLSSSAVARITVPSDMGGALLSQFPSATDSAGNSYVPLNVSTDFFSSGGFATTSLTAAGIILPSSVTLSPTVASLVVQNPSTPSATTIAGAATPVLLAAGFRPASSLALRATGDLWNRGGAGATGYQTLVDTTFYALDIAGTIETDPKGSVALTGDQIAIVSGTVKAPGGTITLGGGTYTAPGLLSASASPVPLIGEGG